MKHKFLFCFVLAAALHAPAVLRADILLTIDFTDPSAVRFSGAPGLSSTSITAYGLTLPNFFPFGVRHTVNLTDASSTLLSVVGGAASGGLGYFNQSSDVNELTLYPLVNGGSLLFTDGTVALQGTSVFDLSSLTAQLPQLWSVGTVLAYTGNSAVEIGQFQVVPEPSTWVMAGVGIARAGWGALRRRKRRDMGSRQRLRMSITGSSSCDV